MGPEPEGVGDQDPYLQVGRVHEQATIQDQKDRVMRLRERETEHAGRPLASKEGA